MSNDSPVSFLAGLMIKPAIKKFVTEHRNIYATFRLLPSDHLKIEMFDCDLAANVLPGGAEPIVSVVMTPEQQYQAGIEFMKIAGTKK